LDATIKPQEKNHLIYINNNPATKGSISTIPYQSGKLFGSKNPRNSSR
jgi:hypothetical protein